MTKRGTVRDFYRRHVRADGRAPILHTSFGLQVWITQPRPERDIFCICYYRRVGIRWVRGGADLCRSYLTDEPPPIDDAAV